MEIIIITTLIAIALMIGLLTGILYSQRQFNEWLKEKVITTERKENGKRKKRRKNK